MSQLRRRIPWSLVLLFGLAVVGTPSPGRAQCNGNAFLDPVGLPANIVRFQRTMQIVNNVSTDSSFKILFDFLRLYPPPTGQTPYHLFGDIFSHYSSHTDNVCTTWPPIGTITNGHAQAALAIQDYPNSCTPPCNPGSGKLGVKTSDPNVLPRETLLVDNIPGLWSRGADLQVNLNGMIVVIDHARGATTTDTTGWQCNGTLPAGTYRRWDTTASVSDGCNTVAQATANFVAPDANAKYIGAFTMATEFFTSSPGLFKIYLSTLRVQTEGNTAWQNVCTWQVTSQCGSTNEYGFKLTTVPGGATAIEVSNDGPANGGPGGFFPVGTIFTIPGCT
jgi:hypothetical protein